MCIRDSASGAQPRRLEGDHTGAGEGSVQGASWDDGKHRRRADYVERADVLAQGHDEPGDAVDARQGRCG
eukprot:3233335-Prorocentrum_lima.AAC.1